jgi:hypothetical protein
MSIRFPQISPQILKIHGRAPFCQIAALQFLLNTTTLSREMSEKERLANTTYDSLDAMMQAYAAEAVRIAGAEHRVKLDYSPASMDALENILSTLTPPQTDDLEWLTKLWGSYFGEVFRRRYSSTWTMSEYPGGQLSIPTVEIGGSRIYPLLKIHRRLTLGETENLVTFTQMARKRLDGLHPLPN